jgi:hypothetical protein
MSSSTEDENENENTDEQELHDCGYVVDTFACKIRHQTLLTGDANMRLQRKIEEDKAWQRRVYGV